MTMAIPTATWQSASSVERGVRFVLLGNPGSRRVNLFQAALARLSLPPAQVVAYADLLAGRASLRTAIRPGDVVRIESPGKEWKVERALLALGSDRADDAHYERLPRETVDRLVFERGRILAPRQWYRGWYALLKSVRDELDHAPACRLMNSTDEIALMFDKRRCHRHLLEAGIAVPPALGEIASFEELTEQMRAAGWSRVFLKLAHGSSASGAVAYQTSRGRHLAISTVEMAYVDGTLRLYNTRRLRTYRAGGEIAQLVDALCRHCVHVERWLPKAGMDGRTIDLRVVTIEGRTRHVVVRASRGPITNLHLLNARGDTDALVARMGAEAWAAACATCEHTAACFPGSHAIGIDLLVAPGFRRHAVLEVNAFGDLLPGVLCDGEETYAAEVLAMQEGVVRTA